MVGPLLGCALFGDQLVSNIEGLFRTTGRAQVETVFTVDDHGRYALHAILLGQLFVLSHFALDGERVEGLEELGFVDPLGSNEISHVFRLGQTLAFLLDSIEYGVMNLLLNAHGVQGDEELAMGIPWATEQRWDALEVHVGREFFSPRVDGRLKGVA